MLKVICITEGRELEEGGGTTEETRSWSDLGGPLSPLRL